MAAGMLAGIPLNFAYVIAGAWGFFDTSATRNLIVAVMSAAVLAVTLLAAFTWTGESAAVWFTAASRGPRRVHAAMLVTGILGLWPAILAWTVTSGLPLGIQLLVGIAQGQQPYIGGWPAVTAVSSHMTALGAFDIVPGGPVLLALPCLFVVARGLRRADPGDDVFGARVPVASVLATGLTAAGISVAVGLVLMLSLHAVIGAAQITRAGGFGLLYLNRALELVIAACAGIGAAWVAQRAGRARLTSGILCALVTVSAAAVFAPKLLFLGELGWGYRHVNPAAYPILYGIVGNMTAGKAVAAALLLIAAGGAAGRLIARFRPHAAGTGPQVMDPGPARAGVASVLSLRTDAAFRLVTVLGCAALLTGLTIAAYYYFFTGYS
jgi:hypothetical protein